MNILIVDDDPAMTDLLKLLLQPASATIFSANSGIEGIRLVKLKTPDIILLDLMMPEMDGWQVCKQVREFSKVPILVLSALDNPSMVATALDSGADDYLIKPVASGILLAHINKLMRRTQADPGIAPAAA
jgi:DNA-binding response OmpR family regulator